MTWRSAIALAALLQAGCLGTRDDDESCKHEWSRPLEAGEQVNGHDPVELIRAMGSRVRLLHMKDMAPTPAREDLAPGDGVLDWTSIVTTATGQQRRIEVGNAIAQVNAVDVVQTQAVSQVADLLVSKAAGVTVFTGVQTGAGTRIRIRGTSSLSLSNNPIFVIDGIRVEGTTGSSSVSVGGTTPARIGDINPEEIESIEVVRGPSASTLYGVAVTYRISLSSTARGNTSWRRSTVMGIRCCASGLG